MPQRWRCIHARCAMRGGSEGRTGWAGAGTPSPPPRSAASFRRPLADSARGVQNSPLWNCVPFGAREVRHGGERPGDGGKGFLESITTLVEKLAKFAEKGEQLQTSGEVGGQEEGFKGVYGRNVRIGGAGLGPGSRFTKRGAVRQRPPGPGTGKAIVQPIREPLVDVFDEGPACWSWPSCPASRQGHHARAAGGHPRPSGRARGRSGTARRSCSPGASPRRMHTSAGTASSRSGWPRRRRRRNRAVTRRRPRERADPEGGRVAREGPGPGPRPARPGGHPAAGGEGRRHRLPPANGAAWPR